MNVADLDPILQDILQAIGFASRDGNLDSHWFDDPLAKLSKLLSDDQQRAALLDLLDQVAPPDSSAGAPADEKWHPLLPTNDRGNVYLTIKPKDAKVFVGLAMRLATPSATVPQASLMLRQPSVLVGAGAVTFVAGDTPGPLVIDVRMQLGLKVGDDGIGLSAVRAGITIAPRASTPLESFVITLEGLDLDGSGAHDLVVEQGQPLDGLLSLVIGLIQQKLHRLGGSGGLAGAVAVHLPPLIGLDGTIPRFPFATVAQPGAVRAWFSSLAADSARLTSWFSHVGGLAGAGGAIATAAGTPEDPWCVALFDAPNQPRLDATLALGNAADGTPQVQFGVQVSLVSGGAASVGLQGRAMLLAVPLRGTGVLAVLPRASVGLRSPSTDAVNLIPGPGTITIGRLQAGVAWDGTQAAPFLELVDVNLDGTAYPRLDLSNADGVLSAASGVVSSRILNALGGGPGASLAALATLLAPQADAAMQLADLARFVADPTGEMAAKHRLELLSAAGWAPLLAELGALLGLGRASQGHGTADDPWRSKIADAGPLTLSLAAWNAQTSGNPADPQWLRVGFSAGFATAKLSCVVSTAVLAIDLPASGKAALRLFSEHRSHVELAAPRTLGSSGVQIDADRLALTVLARTGIGVTAQGAVTNVRVAAGAAVLTIPSLTFPGPASIDPLNPVPAVGLSTSDLERFALLLTAEGLSGRFGSAGVALAALGGFSNQLAGLDPAAPLLGDPAVAGRVFVDPAAAWRGYLQRLAISTGGAELPITNWCSWLAALLDKSLPPIGQAPSPVNGCGTYDDPWRIPVASDALAIDGLVWLEPEGPSLPVGLTDRIAAAASYDELLAVVTAVPRIAGTALLGRDPAQFARALATLDVFFGQSDGVVAVVAQQPGADAWEIGPVVTAAHEGVPAAPDAIAAILAQLDAWTAGERTVLLLGPGFLDHTVWGTFLAEAEAQRPGRTNANALFDLRIAGNDPASIDLRTVTVSADYYVADLADDGAGVSDPLLAQIDRVVARLAELRPGVAPAIVAHSTVGVAARAYVAAHPGKLKGLITLASPHLGSTVPPLSDPQLADALRGLRALVPAGLDGPIGAALANLLVAADAALPAASAGNLSVPRAYPLAAFGGASISDTAGVPAYAIGSQLPGTLLDALRSALVRDLQSLAAPPTHLAFGISTALPLPADHGISVSTRARLDLTQLPLVDGTPDPVRAPTALTVTSELSSTKGWLVGAPSAQLAAGTRLRRAEIGCRIAPGARGPVATINVRLNDGALDGPTATLVSWADDAAPALLGAMMHAVADPAPATGTALRAWLNALVALKLAVDDPHGGAGLALDGFNALALDPLGFLAPRLSAALTAGGFLGFVPAPDGWALPLGATPLTLVIDQTAPSFGMRCAWLPLDTDIGLGFELALDLHTLRPRASGHAHIGPATLATARDGTLSIVLPPFLDAINLVPASGVPALHNTLAAALPGWLFGRTASALLASLLGPRFALRGLDSFLAAPGAWLAQGTAPGGSAALSAAAIRTLLEKIATAIGAPAAPGTLDVGPLRFTASGTTSLDLALATPAPLAGLDLALKLTIDPLLHAAPSGSVSYHTALGGTWPGLTLSFAIGTSGIVVKVTPDGGSPITLLPTFSGLGVLSGGASALLPTALDRLVGAAGAASSVAALALKIAQALDLYDAVGGFTAHTAQLLAMRNPGWAAGVGAAVRTAAATQIGALFNNATSPLRGAIPGNVTVSGDSAQWRLDAGANGTFTLVAGWDGAGPTFLVEASGFAPASSGVAVSASAGLRGARLGGDVAIAPAVLTALGYASPNPQLNLSLSETGVVISLLPLGEGTGSTLSIGLVPALSIAPADGALDCVLTTYALPLALDLLLARAHASLAESLWAGAPSGPTVRGVLQSAELLDSLDHLKLPLPRPPRIALGAVRALASGIDVAVTPSLHLSGPTAGETGSIGVRVHGSIDIGSDPVVHLRFGEPAAWLADADKGATMTLFDSAGSFAPKLRIVGLGLGLDRGEAPLVNLDGFRLGGATGYLFAAIDLAGGPVQLGAALELDKLGLPLNQLSGASSDDPVAAGLFEGTPGAGDPHPVNPALDLVLFDWPTLGFGVQIAGNADATKIVIPIHRGFGPIYINQLEVGVEGEGRDLGLDLGIDGQVKIDGLSVSVDELGVAIPLHAAMTPGRWSLRLAGLAVAFQNGPVSISGGLRKNIVRGTTEYDGMLSVKVSDLGFTAVGGYSRPVDQLGTYTSFFAFVSLPLPLGGPPFLFVTGLGGGFGVNRQLLIPDDLSHIDDFPLVEAINNDLDANDPMQALVAMGKDIPAKRGAFWIAAGVRATSFVIVNERVIVAVSIDRGFEIDVLGIARMALPTEELAIASVELALKARFNSVEGLLSVQAQLTDNSYLFSHDCQLTGGFAFFIWFPKSTFVLTLGGYHPAFQKRPEFPDIPRLGFNWHVSDIIIIKGGAYFALTNSCVMAGGSLEAAADLDVIKAWFTAFCDMLISWDPFRYAFDIGVEIGLTVHFKVCFAACAHVSLTLKRGASLKLEGPPLHGSVTVDAYITSVTIPFGPDARPQSFVGWDTFKRKYLTAGDAEAAGVDTRVVDGLVVADPPGVAPLPGTHDQPWRLGAGFAFATETRMPANSAYFRILGRNWFVQDTGHEIDIAPMQEVNVAAVHHTRIEFVDGRATPEWFTLGHMAQHFTFAPLAMDFPEGVWLCQEPQTARAGNIKAIGGLSLIGQALLENPSALIPFAQLFSDELSARLPLPFAPAPTTIEQYIAFGVAAESLATLAADLSVRQTFVAAHRILSGDTFATGRTQVGASAGGLTALAVQSLRARRSAPPRIAPLATGLSRKPVGMPAPNAIEVIPPANPVPLTTPRLKAAFQHPTTPMSLVVAATRTTVRNASIALADVPRMAPPRIEAVLGARLHLVAPAGASRVARMARDVRVLHHSETGALLGVAHAKAMAKAAIDVLGDGITVAAGTTQLWDLPDSSVKLTISGDAARLTCLDRAGRVVRDDEFAGDGTVRSLHADTAAVAVTCLGKAPDVQPRPQPLSLAVAASGRPPAVGWQAANRVLQVGSASLLGRGSAIRLIQPRAAKRAKQSAFVGLVQAANAVAGQAAVETRLPIAVDVVMVLLDLVDPTAADTGDFAAGVTGAVLDGPIVVSGGRRRALLYDVRQRDAKAAALTVSIASASAWQLSGVVGLSGVALEWAVRFKGSIPDDLIADGPFTADGSSRLHMTMEAPQ